MGHGSQEQIYYYHLGTPIMLTDSKQGVAWDATYEPFGKASITTASVTNNIRFPGQYYDTETGLHYNWNRYYWPEVGRYVSSDPIFEFVNLNIYNPEYRNEIFLSFYLDIPDDLHKYIYVRNNPQTLIDPYGLTVYYCYGKIRVYPHAYVCLDQECSGLMPSSHCPGGGIITKEIFTPQDCMEKDVNECCDRNKYENCIRQKIINERGKCHYYGVFTYNCISWARDVILTCQKEACRK